MNKIQPNIEELINSKHSIVIFNVKKQVVGFNERLDLS